MRPPPLPAALALLVLACAGCTPQPPPKIRAATVILAPGEGPLLRSPPVEYPAGTPVREAAVRPPVLRAYPLRRYVDAEDPGLMHEAHVVYRIEEGPAWKLDAQPAWTPENEALPDAARELSPAARQELQTFLAEQRRLLEALRTHIEALGSMGESTGAEAGNPTTP